MKNIYKIQYLEANKKACKLMDKHYKGKKDQRKKTITNQVFGCLISEIGDWSKSKFGAHENRHSLALWQKRHPSEGNFTVDQQIALIKAYWRAYCWIVPQNKMLMIADKILQPYKRKFIEESLFFSASSPLLCVKIKVADLIKYLDLTEFILCHAFFGCVSGRMFLSSPACLDKIFALLCRFEGKYKTSLKLMGVCEENLRLPEYDLNGKYEPPNWVRYYGPEFAQGAKQRNSLRYKYAQRGYFSHLSLCIDHFNEYFSLFKGKELEYPGQSFDVFFENVRSGIYRVPEIKDVCSKEIKQLAQGIIGNKELPLRKDSPIWPKSWSKLRKFLLDESFQSNNDLRQKVTADTPIVLKDIESWECL